MYSSYPPINLNSDFFLINIQAMHFPFLYPDLLFITIGAYKYTQHYLPNFVWFDTINNTKIKKGDIIMGIAVLFLLYMAWHSGQ